MVLAIYTGRMTSVTFLAVVSRRVRFIFDEITLRARIQASPEAIAHLKLYSQFDTIFGEYLTCMLAGGPFVDHKP